MSKKPVRAEIRQPNPTQVTKAGISFSTEILEKIDSYAEVTFRSLH